MANSLSAFFSENAQKIENKKIVVSNRFIDPETGKPMEWEFKAITSSENQKLRKKCTINVPVGNKGQYVPQVDVYTYQLRLAAKSTIFPDLNNSELQDSYHAMDAESLLGEMLLSSEFDDYVAAIVKHGGYQLEDEVVDEAKN